MHRPGYRRRLTPGANRRHFPPSRLLAERQSRPSRRRRRRQGRRRL